MNDDGGDPIIHTQMRMGNDGCRFRLGERVKSDFNQKKE